MRYIRCRPLIVEDDPAFRDLLRNAFGRAGVPPEHVCAVSDGDEALEILEPGWRRRAGVVAPSLLVLDVYLPRRSGLEVLDWVRGSSSFPEVPAFVLSSSEEPALVSRAFQLRADSYFVKPADPAELVSIVEGMLGHWHTRTHRRVPGSLRHASTA